MKLTKKNRETYNKLFPLFHQLVKAYLSNNRESFEETITQVKQIV